MTMIGRDDNCRWWVVVVDNGGRRRLTVKMDVVVIFWFRCMFVHSFVNEFIYLIILYFCRHMLH